MMCLGVRGPVFEGVVVGQVATIAVWAATGQSYRLTRGSLLVVGVGVLALLSGARSPKVYSRTLTLMAAYVLVVVVTTLAIVWLRSRLRSRFGNDPSKTPLQVPLIEFFGWTIVVAIISFGARYMDVQFLERVQHLFPVYLLTYAIVPLALILFESKFRFLQLISAALFLAVVYWMGTHFFGRGPWYGLKVVSTAGYLTAWLLMRNIEQDQLCAAVEGESSGQTADETELLDSEQ